MWWCTDSRYCNNKYTYLEDIWFINVQHLLRIDAFVQVAFLLENRTQKAWGQNDMDPIRICGCGKRRLVPAFNWRWGMDRCLLVLWTPLWFHCSACTASFIRKWRTRSTPPTTHRRTDRSRPPREQSAMYVPFPLPLLLVKIFSSLYMSRHLCSCMQCHFIWCPWWEHKGILIHFNLQLFSKLAAADVQTSLPNDLRFASLVTEKKSRFASSFSKITFFFHLLFFLPRLPSTAVLQGELLQEQREPDLPAHHPWADALPPRQPDRQWRTFFRPV